MVNIAAQLPQQHSSANGLVSGQGQERKNNSRKNEGMEPKQKQHPAVDVTGDRSNKAVKSNIA